MIRREVAILALVLIVLCVVSWLGYSQMTARPPVGSGGGNGYVDLVVIHSFSSAPDLTMPVIVHEMSLPNKHRGALEAELAFARNAVRLQEYLGLFGPGLSRRDGGK